MLLFFVFLRSFLLQRYYFIKQKIIHLEIVSILCQTILLSWLLCTSTNKKLDTSILFLKIVVYNSMLTSPGWTLANHNENLSHHQDLVQPYVLLLPFCVVYICPTVSLSIAILFCIFWHITFYNRCLFSQNQRDLVVKGLVPSHQNGAEFVCVAKKIRVRCNRSIFLSASCQFYQQCVSFN